jgi:YVTN family beta-propeller protein
VVTVGAGGAGGGVPGPVLSRPSKSSTIAISDDDKTVAVVNSEDNSVSFFDTASNGLRARVPTGGEPSSVVIHPDNKTAFVANRADATVVKISLIDSESPMVSTPVDVGAEPTGLALSPTGAKLFVAEYAEGRIGVIDTATMKRSDFATKLRPIRALTVTNNGNPSDDDETVIAPEFFGVPEAGKEAKNDGRTGRVHLFDMKGAEKGPITLGVFTNQAPFETQASPNQLYSVVVAKDQIYIPSVSASPNLPLGSDKNVYPIVYVASLETKAEVKGAAGSTNLAQLVNAFPAGQRFFLGELVDIDFRPTSSVAYAVSRAGEAVQRIEFGSTVSLGSPQVKQIDVLGAGASSCQQPNGIAVASKLEKAYVNCWVTRRLAILDLTSQKVEKVVDSAALPAANTLEGRIVKGRHFYFTGRGRWSGNGSGTTAPTEDGSGWSSCGTCHPDGLTDNITWIFAAGPRQTTSMDGSYSHGPGAQKPRIFNWTGIIDEMHDFEANTRGTSGGRGAITTTTITGMCGTLAMETRSSLSAAPMGTPVSKETQDTQLNNCTKDWDDIDAFAKTIRPPRARRFSDAASVTKGAAIFANKGGCVKCHGGAGWTISRRFFVPSINNNGAAGLPAQSFAKPSAFAPFASGNVFQIAAQNPAADTFVAAAIPPLQLSCSLRSVDSFGVPGNVAATDALETRPPFVLPPNPPTTDCKAEPAKCSTRAQGRGGYNVPSLYGLALGAPYLHHGQAETLEALFTDAKWKTHWEAGNPNFLKDADAMTDVTDLINFLLSIDAKTTELPVPSGFADGCKCRDGSTPPEAGCPS